MSTKIFVNIPVKDLQRSMEFFTRLGCTFNKQFTDEKAACLVFSDDIFFMLLVEKYFKSFVTKEITDTNHSTEAIFALALDSRAEVNGFADRAMKAGAKKFRDPQDDGWMYGRSFEDLDGHLWEVFYMDPSHIVQQ